MTKRGEEYEMTCRLPRTFSFEGGPKFTRQPLLHVVGGSVLSSWATDSGGTQIVYRQVADPSDQLGRGVYVVSSEYEQIPVSAGVALAEAFTPDQFAAVAQMVADDIKATAMLLFPINGGPNRPGIN